MIASWEVNSSVGPFTTCSGLYSILERSDHVSHLDSSMTEEPGGSEAVSELEVERDRQEMVTSLMNIDGVDVNLVMGEQRLITRNHEKSVQQNSACPA